MPEQRQYSRLLIPALRAHMGDWYYYICCLKFKDITERIGIAKDFHETNRVLSDKIQRNLREPRLEDIKNYLLSQPQRFFNSIVVGVYGGDPNFIELNVKLNEYQVQFDEEELGGILGYLILDGKEKIFALDGQHRVEGIKRTLNEDATLDNEEVCTIFVAHKSDEDGLKRTRRLFTTLNRYAKPVGTHDIIALDEEDYCAILTRKIVEEFEPFQDAIIVKNGKNILPTDKQNLTSIETLFESINGYLKPFEKKWKKYRHERPSNLIIDSHYTRLITLFKTMLEEISDLKHYTERPKTTDRAINFRHSNGGQLLFRPIGFISIIKTISRFQKDGVELRDAIKLINKMPLELSEKPWSGLIWDNENNRMITESRQRIIEQILYFSLGGDLSKHWRNSTEDTLKSQLAGYLNLNVSDVEINIYG